MLYGKGDIFNVAHAAWGLVLSCQPPATPTLLTPASPQGPCTQSSL